ncbi:AAA family ATPase [Acetobacter vaccinii]|uniref:ATP-binding protein n=1 Tax=Acetobacter vaccinii TaxID=2592655 RepID=A0A5C1YSZ1_9PROT|nr:AAA family ATPase [Acetobacter vaccinii]QEO18835.1 ATP-binding protein [Acetobacter vaccinii]
MINFKKISDLDKFNYIIGDNGSGKSLFLANKATELSLCRPVIVISFGTFDKFTYGSRPKMTANGSYTYQGNRTVGNGIHNGTMSANVVILYTKIINKKRLKNINDFLESIGFDKRVGISYRETKSKSQYRFDMVDLNASYIKNNHEILSAKEKPFEGVFYKKGQHFLFSSLSSGEQLIISTALKIIANSQDDACFFIDEPEISLHVEWQVKWPEKFQSLLSIDSNTTAYIATHSPVIISSALKSGANCFYMKEGDLIKIDENDFNVEGIIFNEFNTITPDNKYLYTELADVISSAVEKLSTGGASAPEEVRKDFEKLKEKISNTSKTMASADAASKTIKDFELAIEDLIRLSEDLI